MDLDSDGNVELIVCVPSTDSDKNNYFLLILNNKGEKLWEYSFPEKVNWMAPNGIVVSDLNNDGTLEIIVGVAGEIMDLSEEIPEAKSIYGTYPIEGVYVFGDKSNTDLMEKKPNLYVPAVWLYYDVNDPTFIQVESRVYNTAAYYAVEKVNVEVLLDYNNSSIPPTVLDNFTISLNPFDLEPIVRQYHLPLRIGELTNTSISVRVDPYNEIDEQYENDNNASAPIDSFYF